MQLQLCTWQEVDEYLARSQGIIVPIGSTEQHGPTGLIGTDAICAEAVALEVGRRAEALVAPVFGVGRAEHHMAFAGTITLRRSTMIAAIHDWVRSLARHGFERIFFINGHGGNIPVLKAAFKSIDAARLVSKDGGTVKCAAHSWWTTPGARKLSKQLYGEAEGSHATPSEVAMAQHVHPDFIKTAKLEPRIAPTGRISGPADYRRRFPDGRIGSDPSLATPEAGGRIIDAAAADLTMAYRKFAGLKG